MVKFELYMSDDDCHKIFALKAEAGKHYDNKSGNDYAEILLHRYLEMLYPRSDVKCDEDGEFVPRKR